MRIDRFLSHMNVASRKELKVLFKAGRVRVDGTVVKDAKFKVNEATVVYVDDEPVRYQTYFYWLMNKPAGVISATTDPQKTVLDLLAPADLRDDLFPVGRLDKDTTGLLLLTNDGDLSHALLSPKKHVSKVYRATIAGIVTAEDQARFEAGLVLSDFTAQPAQLEILSVDEAQQESQITVEIHEGKFHQVKRMFHAVGKEVLTLERLEMGPLALPDDLDRGQYRALTDAELALLKAN
ncbi:rRNA pseudouridine synthase [Latilactobacillus curvatus]|uniref:pseudouridine synthase n=1 Tax=Latilactobacillus curvatus TaxID=28038 RepID=UPI000977489D|nr:pseudouridine synthase [Latilactobacillus curvatus]MCT1216263.1 rRNA pseudouridine synthase [Latilactobacillus curvatus]MCT3524991.1 rRNA pseudouridine synthase [Latilactobacillus curvatus]MCT3531903.1 rRNA pseudouridine synthase [Latilactobacillus curvatus]MCW8779049.1 rRNA pseudouridine synthase [Latilactobacillus curvatus]MED9788468.1 pseudouridine synthase [Latilactobacillus curvatus]